MNQDQLKQQAALAAVDYIVPKLEADSVIGIGTGSTANFFIDALATSKHRFDGAVASSSQSAERLNMHGIPVYDLNTVERIALYVDGADEINPRLQMIKGGGGALTREKIVAAVAEEFVCIADESKLVAHLGTFPLPLEVIPMARALVARACVALGATPVYREGVVTDNGNQILDLHNFHIPQPLATESTLNNITGIVCNGLFAARGADFLFMGTGNGVRELHPESS